MAQDQIAQEKSRVAVLSLLASALLASVKFAAALFSGSLSLLSEAFHSLLDCAATALTLFAIKVSEKPADDEHHFGHAKVESVVALVETGLLFLVAIWVAYEALTRLWTGGETITLSWWLFAILFASIIIDYNRYHALEATAQRSGSDALAADALHFRADMWSSAAVLGGLGATALGFAYGDTLAALVVAVFVAKAGYQLGQRTLNSLLDAAPAGSTEKLRLLIESTNGVLAVSQLRVRPSGPILFIDVRADVARTLSVSAIEQVRRELIDKVRSQFEEADVTVQTQAVALDSETAFDKVSHIASLHDLSVHHLAVQDLAGKLAVSFDLEIDGQTPLLLAHQRATELEAAIRQGLGGDVEVESHIEPYSGQLLEGVAPTAKYVARLEKTLRTLSKREKSLSDLHNIRVRENTSGLFVHYHCRFAPDMKIEAVHDVIDRIDLALCNAMPEIKRVVAHAEPIGQARHGV